MTAENSQAADVEVLLEVHTYLYEYLATPIVTPLSRQCVDGDAAGCTLRR
jgi:hypothetical protein